MRVDCCVEDTLIEQDGVDVEGIAVTCDRCGHEVEIAGADSPETRRKAACQLRKTCPKGELNRYVFEEDGSEAFSLAGLCQEDATER
jgi:hypothetical protein